MSIIRFLIVLTAAIAFLPACNGEDEQTIDDAAPLALSDQQRTAMLTTAKQISDELSPELKSVRGAMAAEPMLAKAFQAYRSSGIQNVILEDPNVFAMAESGSMSWSFDLGNVVAEDGEITIVPGTYGSLSGGAEPADAWAAHKRVELASGKADLLIIFAK